MYVHMVPMCTQRLFAYIKTKYIKQKLTKRAEKIKLKNWKVLKKSVLVVYSTSKLKRFYTYRSE